MLKGTEVRPEMRPFWHRLSMALRELGRHREADGASRQLDILIQREEEENDEH